MVSPEFFTDTNLPALRSTRNVSWGVKVTGAYHLNVPLITGTLWVCDRPVQDLLYLYLYVLNYYMERSPS